jgi:hypothetical protein
VSTSPSEVHQAWSITSLSALEFAGLGSGNGGANRGDSGSGLSAEQLRYLAGFGLLAPTSHNTVPQRFRLLPASAKLEVLADRRFVLPESDATGRQCLVSLGCCWANLELAARALGFDLQVHLHPVERGVVTPWSEGAPGPRYVRVFDAEFIRGTAAPEPHWLDWMREHKVMRAEFDRGARLPRELVQSLSQEGAPPAGAQFDLRVHVLEDTLVLKAMGRFQEQADRFVLENRRFARELGEWLLPNDNTTAAVGMRGAEFGFDDAFSLRVHGGLLGESTLLPDEVAGFAKGARLGLESSAAVVVISAERDDAAHQLGAGRLAQRISLQLQGQGFWTAYHAALTEVGWAGTLFATSVLHTRRRPLVVFRVGQPKRAEDRGRPHASRPRLEQVLID